MVCVCPPHTSISLYCRPGSHSPAIFAARALDRAALASGVPSLKCDHHRPLPQIDLISQLAKLNLPPRYLAHISVAIQPARPVDSLQHQSPPPPSDSIASRNSASLAAAPTTSTLGGAFAPRRFSMAPMMVSKILFRACHFEVASTIVQGANSDSVNSSISSVALRYSPYFLCRAQSAPVTRQASSGFCSMVWKRSFCSFLLM